MKPRAAKWMLLLPLLLAGCEKKAGGGPPAPAASPAASPAAPTAVAPEAKAAGPSARACESVEFTPTDQKGELGWPRFKAQNRNDRAVKSMSVHAYAYDGQGNQVGRTQIPLNWYGNLAPGDEAAFDLVMDQAEKVPAPAAAASFEACCYTIQLEGEADEATEPQRCPQSKPPAKTPARK